MAFCGKCGTKLEDNAKFCPACGASASAEQDTQQSVTPSVQSTQQSVEQAVQSNIAGKIVEMNNTTDTTANFDATDIQNNKVMAILAYFGPLVLIPIFAAKESKFVRFHANQGLVLLLTAIVCGIVYNIISGILLAISWRLYFVTSIIGLWSIAITVLAIIGIVNAVNGRAKELPIIGVIKILK